MSLPTNRQEGDVIEDEDINAIAAAVNALEDALAGKADAATHETILLTAVTTLPTEHPVLTVRATAPSHVTVPAAPDGTVVTVHVAEGWEHITWASGIVVTGDTSTTETWVVLVRAEGVWQALVSGEGGGGLSGIGSPQGVVSAPVGAVYMDTAGTDGAWTWRRVEDSGSAEGWRVTEGRLSKEVQSTLTGSAYIRDGGWFFLEREGDVVSLSVQLLTREATIPATARPNIARGLPKGWGPISGDFPIVLTLSGDTDQTLYGNVNAGGVTLDARPVETVASDYSSLTGYATYIARTRPPAGQPWPDA